MDGLAEQREDRSVPHLELTDAELATATTACRATAYAEEKRARALENQALRRPIEEAARQFERLAAKLEAARNN
jgi:hypothetical protein